MCALDQELKLEILQLQLAGAHLEGAKVAKDVFQILAKCCVFIAAPSKL